MTLDEQAETIAEHYERVNARLGDDVLTFRGLLESGVILPGPAVTEGIEEAHGDGWPDESGELTQMKMRSITEEEEARDNW